MIERMVNKIKSDNGLMGPTHALSAVSASLLVAWVASDFMFGTLLGTTDIVVFVSAVIIIVGASLMPDLDAVNSTSISTLGPVGVVLSNAMRGFSKLIQNLIKGPGDKGSDPHRGFWHTFVSVFIIGLFVSSLTSINIDLFTMFGTTVTIAKLIVIFIIYISIQLGLAGLFKPFYKKNNAKITGKIAIKVSSLLTAVALLYFLPTNVSYSWVGAAVAFGWLAHLLGDMMTVAGVPVLFPLKYKGKRWWNFRFPFGIKAGGFVEKTFLIPIFSIIIILSLFNIIPVLGK